MLKSGLFMTPNGQYAVYEVDEPGFYRIDFIRDNGNFQIDIDKVVYSQVHRKTTYVLGDSALYDEYLKAKATIESAQMKTKKDASWVGGVYVTQTHSENTKLGYTIDTKLENGAITECVLSGGGYVIQSFVIDAVYGVKLEPLNFSEYVSINLSADTISTVDGDAVFYPLNVLRRRIDLSHIDKKNYVVATDVDTALKRLHEFKLNPCPVKGFDTETTGTDVDIYGEDVMVGIILGHDKDTATYFPFRHKGDFNLPMDFLPTLMNYVLEAQDCLVAHNKKFDRKVMLKEGYDVCCKWDTMQLSIVLNPIIKKGAHALKTLIYELNGLRYLELDDIFVNSRDIDFSLLPIDLIKYYACPDGSNVIELLQDQLTKLPKYQYRLACLECDLADVKADQEFYGIRVDVKKYERQYKNCNYIIDQLLKAFRLLTNEDGNINSSQVLIPLLYNKMKCKVLMRTKTGQASTSSLAIKKLAKLKADKPHPITEDLVDLYGNVIIKAKDLANAKYPALVILAKYREYNKLKTAFYARFERTMKTGRIFFWVNQNGAATGRQSSPMHQLPPELKEVILADDVDRDFWGPDFSQIELRMIAYLAGERDLIELAKDPDNDIHRVIGSLISNKEMWAITKEERSTGKRRNFGVVYLISAMGLAGQIFGPGYTTENVEFCQQQLDEFYHKFKRIDRYIKRNAQLVKKNGYMETAWYHRKRLFPEVFDPDIEPRRLASILRMANNVPVQGTSADYLKLAEVQMFNYIREKGWNVLKNGFPLVRMMLSIHDEIIISADNSIPYEEIVKMITMCMETPVEGAPPFFVQPARMDNWEGHSDDSVAMPIGFRDKIIKDFDETGESIFKNAYFDLVITDDVKAFITENETTKTLSEIVDYCIDKCSLKFNHGNYEPSFNNEHVKAALVNYITSGFTCYRIDNYRNLLNDYRDTKLRGYMTELIQKYGTDYKVVGQKVRHPSLTHDLLGNYHEQLKGLDMSHEELITEATKLYIEDLLNSSDKQTSFVFEIKDTHRLPTDKDAFSEQMEQIVNFDNEGNVIYETSEEEDDDVSYYGMDEDPDSIIYRVSENPTYVWELADCITFDVQGLSNDDVNKVLSYIFKFKDDNGFFRTNLIYANKLIDTGIRVENLDLKEANDVVLSLCKETVVYD